VTTVQRILRFDRVVGDLGRAVAFYRDALGFSVVAHGPLDASTTALLAAGEAMEAQIRLGAQDIGLVQFAAPPLPPPPNSRSNDLWFQHLAIVVSDMGAAYAHLRNHSGWSAITMGGPRTLPPQDGAVIAFKFRDPDGHPLELIWYPHPTGAENWQRFRGDGLFLGIAHSAMAISCRPTSLRFYRSLGLRVTARSLNAGPAQAQLDGLPRARVRVTALRPRDNASPGLELLRYARPGRVMPRTSTDDEITDWVVGEAASGSASDSQLFRDPDGHRIIVLPRV
jgi:catechol 2,3-dioxygenase-like lactoylglutathione lyase family enzyme